MVRHSVTFVPPVLPCTLACWSVAESGGHQNFVELQAIMKNPTCASAITHGWVEFVLQYHETKSNPGVLIQLSTFTVILATKPGESFNAELIRVDASAKLIHPKPDGAEGDSREELKDYSFIAKFLSQDPFNREMIKAVNYHVREFVMYSQVVPELNDHWLQHSVNKEVDQRLSVPVFIYGVCNPGEYVLVMENCKVTGFETNDKHKGLDYEHTLIAVNHIARLHALSYSYNQSKQLIEKFPCFEFSRAISCLFKPLVLAALENTIRFVRSLENQPEMLAKLEKGRQTIPVKFQSMWNDQSRHQLLCLTHGDFWNSNLLFRYNPTMQDGKRIIEELKLIDWQISQWGNPVFDLHYLLNTSTTSTLRDQHLDDILHHYHATFTTITESLNCSVPDWTYDQFHAEFAKTSLVGFMMGMCLIQGTLSKAGEKLNPNSTDNSSLTLMNRPGKLFFNKMKTVAAKMFVPVALKPASQFLVKTTMKKVLAPIGAELVEGKNKSMNDRLMDLLNEAEKNGLLDVLSM